ncbi:hypothetical protein P12x_000797 [Tundrisphaera lichenicola]|uniref:hypothetical protein n=1 Tax=Tundrisphaera lichenicola TaxID=2029860 RepID=UPI003EB8CDDB
MFHPGSRYEDLETYAVTDGRGRTITLVKTRFIPPTPGVVGRRIVQQDRQDLLAMEFYRNPELYWRIADANEVIDPAELIDVIGSVIRVPPRP